MIALNEQVAGGDKMKNIENLAQNFAVAHEALRGGVDAMNKEIAAVQEKHLAKIRRLVGTARTEKTVLFSAITEAPELFEKPRTRELHGIKLGFRKGSGGVDWDDDAKVVELIEKHFTKPQAELLIKTTKKPIAKAIADLDVAALKKIGCRVESTGDVVVINAVDSEVDKLVKALLADKEEVEA